MALQKRILIKILLVLTVGLVYMSYYFIPDLYYKKTISFLTSNEELITIKGKVESKSIYHQRDGSLRFNIVDVDKRVIKIVYRGQLLKEIGDHTEVVVKGDYTVENVFFAKEILLN